MARRAGAMIIARKTNARTRSWIIGGVSFGGFGRLGVIMKQVIKKAHPTSSSPEYN